MTEQKDLVPKRRFNEFLKSHAWEQRKLGDITEYIKGFAFKSTDYKETGVRIIRVSDLSKDDIKDTDDNTFIDIDDYHFYVKYRINHEDIIITTVGSKAEMKDSAVGRPIIIKSTEKYLLNQNLVKINPKKEYVSYFIFCQLLQPKYSNYLAMIERGNANQANIAINDLWEYVLQVPSKEEQSKIGALFAALDNLITLHQRKLEKTKALKSAYLSEMFPAEGESEPKRRFAGFTDAWEQRKVVDVIDGLYNGQTPSRFRDEFWNGDINWLSSGELNRSVVRTTSEKITTSGQDSAHLRIVPKDTFVMAITGLEAAGTRGNCAILGIDTTLNQSCMAVFPNKKLLSTQFLFQWYKMVGEDYGIRFTQGTKQQSYNAEIIKNLDICLPTVEEQLQIGEFLSGLDHLITLYQRKLEKLQNLKKAYLNEMFV